MQVGDHVYYLVSGREIRPAVVKQVLGGMCLLQFSTGGIFLPASRVFMTREEAEQHVVKHTPPPDISPKSHGNQMELRDMYDFSGKPLD